jgi:hypothetical protein
MDNSNVDAPSYEGLIAELYAAGEEHEDAFLTLATGEAVAEFLGAAFRPEYIQAAIANGGVPVGLILMDRVDGRLTATTRLCPQYLSALTPSALGFSESKAPTPASRLAEMAQSFLDSVAEGLAYDMDWDMPYRRAIDAAIAEARMAGFRWPLKISIYFKDMDVGETKSFTLFDQRHFAELEYSDDGEDYFEVTRHVDWGLVTHRVNFEPAAPRPWPPSVILLIDSSLPRFLELSFSPKDWGQYAAFRR